MTIGSWMNLVHVPLGPGKVHGKVIHKIVELAIALNLDSLYYVIRNRVDYS
jgi:hypothetical protein